MKRGIVFCFAMALSCQRVPLGPDVSNITDPTVIIEHVSTEYVTATQPKAGILADKANVLFFQIRLANCPVKSLEFLGYATLEGPPDDHQQIVHFWTDSAGTTPQGVEFDVNTLQDIQPDSTYTLVRTKFPTNDYFPFSGSQGKIKQVEWTEAWACDQTGKRFSIKMDAK
jgi:hypothetical protein